MANAWKRIRKWYESHVSAPPYPEFFDWGHPASDADLDALEKNLGLAFPDDLRDTYKVYDGDNKQDILPGGYFMALSEVKTTWEMFKEPVDQGAFNDADANPKGPIKQRWWNTKWIPVLHNGGGDYHCVDMDPDKRGTMGQLIKFQHETGPSHVVAPSFGDFVTGFANKLEAGVYEFDTQKGTVRLATD